MVSKVPPNKTPVAQDVFTYCTRCKIETHHVVMSHLKGYVSKVKCRDCGSEHKYRGAPPGPKKPKKPSSSKPQKTAIEASIEYRELMNEHGSKDPIGYAISKTFALHDIIQHKVFGKGIVTQVLPQKIEVLFQDSVKLLVCNKM